MKYGQTHHILFSLSFHLSPFHNKRKYRRNLFDIEKEAEFQLYTI